MVQAIALAPRQQNDQEAGEQGNPVVTLDAHKGGGEGDNEAENDLGPDLPGAEMNDGDEREQFGAGRSGKLDAAGTSNSTNVRLTRQKP